MKPIYRINDETNRNVIHFEDLISNKKEPRKGPQIRPNRMKVSGRIPTEEELVAIKNKKKVN